MARRGCSGLNSKAIRSLDNLPDAGGVWGGGASARGGSDDPANGTNGTRFLGGRLVSLVSIGIGSSLFFVITRFSNNPFVFNRCFLCIAWNFRENTERFFKC